MPCVDTQLELVNQAFSRQSVRYDAYEENHEILKWMRGQVRTHVMGFLKKSDYILELNSGTGLDAVFFAQHGFKVHATDLSDGMISQLEQKVEMFKLQDRITVQQCSFTSLEEIPHRRYDYVFSNFGGLNCTANLSVVSSSVGRLLKPDGFITVVLMPPVCPWELALIFRGHFKIAVRRLHRNGALAHIEGVYFKTYYFSPGQILKAFGNGFKKIRLQGLASLSPPPRMENFPRRYPKLYKFLRTLDERVAHVPPFNSWSDHFILTMQYHP
ncbi:class I SAM-dependent methyltransferase [Acidobacteria bacterium AH-259-O06]|nr:class I SAM-dependent methyltransferase [Acidobacteria bacterium AH-259-O06]